MNTLLALRGSDERVAVIGPADQWMRVIAGPRRALLRLRREGLIALASEELGSDDQDCLRRPGVSAVRDGGRRRSR